HRSECRLRPGSGCSTDFDGCQSDADRHSVDRHHPAGFAGLVDLALADPGLAHSGLADLVGPGRPAGPVHPAGLVVLADHRLVAAVAAGLGPDPVARSVLAARFADSVGQKHSAVLAGFGPGPVSLVVPAGLAALAGSGSADLAGP